MTRFTPDFVAAVRHRYEDTDQPLRLIFAEFKLSHNALYKMIQDGHWTLRSERTHQLPPATRLLEHVVALADAPAAQDAAAAAAASEPALAPAADATALARVESFLLHQIDAAQAQNGGEHTARTLSILIRALLSLRELRGDFPQPETCNDDDDDDDMPADIDEFRRELARRINEFVKSRTEPGDDRAVSEPALVAKT
jgi:hypothetical protein